MSKTGSVLLKLIIRLGTIWIIIAICTNALLNLRQVSKTQLFNNHYFDAYIYYKNIIVGSVQGSGEFASIDIYSIDDKEKISSLFELETDDSYMELYDLSITPETFRDSLSDGNYFVSDIDFDGKVEVVVYSTSSYKIVWGFLQISKTGEITRDTNPLSIILVQLIAFFRTIWAIIFTVLIAFIVLITKSISLIKHF